jgi:hypothetical protein
MSGPLSLQRRWLLGAMLGIMPMRSSCLLAVPRPENARERVRKTLISLINEPERARKVGTAYLRSPLSRRAPPLGLAEAVLREMAPDAGTEAMRRHIVARIRRELQDGEVIDLDGWIMSLSEARLSGLVAAGEMPRHSA